MAAQASLAKQLLWAFGIWVAHVTAMFVLTVVLTTAVQRQIDILAESDADLPPASVAAVQISYYFTSYWYTLLVPVAIDGAFLTVLALAPPKLAWLAWLWSTLWLLGVILLLGFVSLAISLPLSQLLANAGN